MDFDADGTVDFTHEVTYDATGNVIHLADGRREVECDFYYDQENLYDVTPGAWTRTYWAHDRVGAVRLIGYYCESTSGGEDDSQYWFIYDEHGNLLRHEAARDTPAVEPLWITTYEYSCWQ